MDQGIRNSPPDAELDRMQWVADPDADAAVATILGPAAPDGADPTERLRRADALNAVIRTWQDNEAVTVWGAYGPPACDDLAAPLRRYLATATQMPPWADPQRIARAEQLFTDYGALSVTILFCASLPECYVVPDLAAVLDATGQLEARTEHRIRATGAMIFPVMMRGGLTSPHGNGMAQVLKVRLIHASVRNLILRGSPEEAIARMRPGNGSEGAAGNIAPLASAQPGDSMSRALHVHGWNLAACGLPNNQEELAYTLLTFSYVFLRALRRLRITFTCEQEEDYLHAWNVAGHFLGIRRELMVDTMEEAAELFKRMQVRGRAEWARHPPMADPRARLGMALMDAMESVIPDGAFKDFPEQLTRWLIEAQSSRDLGLVGRVPWASRTLFVTLMGTALGIDAVVRIVFRNFSISRFITRLIGYRLTCALLMSQTRELSVPNVLRPGIRTLIGSWGQDSKAPGWVNTLEDRWTTPGQWQALDRAPAPAPAPPPSP